MNISWEYCLVACDAYKDSKRNKATLSTISTDFNYCAYELLRCLDVQIWQFLCERRPMTDKTDYFTPCTCARGYKLYLL